MFGIDILAANRDQIIAVLCEKGAKQRPDLDRTTVFFDAAALFPGARLFAGFTIDEELENVVFQFDAGRIFSEVLHYDALEQHLIEKYGQPSAIPDESETTILKKSGCG